MGGVSFRSMCYPNFKTCTTNPKKILKLMVVFFILVFLLVCTKKNHINIWTQPLNNQFKNHSPYILQNLFSLMWNTLNMEHPEFRYLFDIGAVLINSIHVHECPPQWFHWIQNTMYHENKYCFFVSQRETQTWQ